jgi:hypothetical protein
MYNLRLSDGRGHTKEFKTELPSLNDQLQAAFSEFYNTHCGRKAVLEVHHRYHGWRPIVGQDGCKTHLLHPRQIDINAITRAITFTLAVMSQRPSTAEQRDLKAQALKEARARAALVRRSQFRLITAAMCD